MDLLDLPDNPVPPDTLLVPVVTADGLTLRAARFPATTRPARGTVVLFQGRGEQIEKYFRLIGDLRARGFAVVTFDWRGQGGSARTTRDTGHVDRFADYALDIDAVRRQVALPDCPPPFFGLAHSMGAHIALANAAMLPPWIQRLVLTAPMLDFGGPPTRRSRYRRLAALACAFGLGKAGTPGQEARQKAVRTFEGNPLTSDRAMHTIMMDITGLRPDLGVGTPTYRWVLEATRSMDALEAPGFARSVPLPVLLVNSGADRIISVSAVERMARRLKGGGYVLIPGAEHEVMMEREIYRGQFFAAFDAFVPGSSA